MEPHVKRCALIYHTTRDNKVFVLIAVSSGELTTIGGRKKKSKRKNEDESNIDCCCREVFEETRELVNYYPCKFGLHMGIIYTYCSCSYYIIEEDYDVLVSLVEAFKTTIAKNDEQNELSELILFDLDKLTEMLLTNAICYKDKLKDFVLNVLYRLLKPKHNKGLFVTDINLPIELNLPMNKLPPIVDWIDEDSYLALERKPTIIGKSLDQNKKGFLINCFYEGCNLYRNNE
jgi:hypothetical protein